MDALRDLVLGSACVGCSTPGRLLCRPCRSRLPTSAHVTAPEPTPPGLAPVTVTGDYADLLRAMVVAHKERRAWGLTPHVGRLLAVAAGAFSGAGPLVMVPVPSAWATVVRRGHDPLLRITRAATADLRSDSHQATCLRLLRLAHRPSDQAGLDSAARLANLSGVMAVAPAALRALSRMGPVQVIVCDDVVTTGATVAEAQRALAEVGVPISGIAAVCATRRVLPLRHRPG